jgi:hypothetical protein
MTKLSDHVLYKDGDENIPASIKDRNGHVALSQCKVCGRGEVELEEPCVARTTTHTVDELWTEALCVGTPYPTGSALISSMLRAGADAIERVKVLEAHIRTIDSLSGCVYTDGGEELKDVGKFGDDYLKLLDAIETAAADVELNRAALEKKP